MIKQPIFSFNGRQYRFIHTGYYVALSGTNVSLQSLHPMSLLSDFYDTLSQIPICLVLVLHWHAVVDIFLIYKDFQAEFVYKYCQEASFEHEIDSHQTLNA